MKETTFEQRKAHLLQILQQEPKTLEDLEADLKVTYWTLWRVLQPMLEEGLIKEAPWREGRKKVFTATNTRQGKTIHILTQGGVQPLGAWAGMTASLETPNPIINSVQDVFGAISQVYRYCAFVNSFESIERARAGAMPPVEVKPILRKSLETSRRLCLAVEQMLIAPIWDNASPETADRFGDIALQTIIDNGSAFEYRHGRGK